MGIEFSTNVRQTATVFTQYRNTIDIYTEDKEEDKVFYVNLLKRLLAGTGIQIKDVYPLGCRNTVINCCQKDTDVKRKKLYIVDGDIYLQFREKDKCNRLYVLDAYCIENFMICEESLCHLAYRLDGRKSYDEVKSLLNIPQVLNNLVHPLIDLFFFYSIHMELYGQYKISHIDTYLDNKKENIDNKKIVKKIEDIRSCLISHGIKDHKIDYLLKKRKEKFPYNLETLLTIVSAKNYIIPYFKHIIHKKMKYDIKIPKESWKFNLVDNYEVERLNGLKEEIIRVSKS